MPETSNTYAYEIDGQEYTQNFRWTPTEIIIVVGVTRYADGSIDRQWIKNHYKDRAGAKRAAQRYCRETDNEYHIAELRLLRTVETMTYWERSKLDSEISEMNLVITAIEKVIDKETTPDGKAALQRVIDECRASVQALNDQLKADVLLRDGN
jgi:hypothetical protein